MSFWRPLTHQTCSERDYFQLPSMCGIELRAESNSFVSICLLSLNLTPTCCFTHFWEGMSCANYLLELPARPAHVSSLFCHAQAEETARENKGARVGISNPGLDIPSKGDLHAEARLQAAVCAAQGFGKVLQPVVSFGLANNKASWFRSLQ